MACKISSVDDFDLDYHSFRHAAFEFPDLTRRLPERTSTPGCAYKGQRYVCSWRSGGNARTMPKLYLHPCCSCVLLKSMPFGFSPTPWVLFGQRGWSCCPSLVCSADKKPKPNETSAESDLRPTFQPETSKKEEETTTTITTTTTNNIEENSLMFVTSTQPNDDIPLLNDIPGGCLVNGTLYGDGSAMLSSSFCEYCFCIRGKTTCLKPKCDLVIEGCTPHFDSHFPVALPDTTATTILDSDETTVTVSTTTVGVTQYSDNQSTCFLAGVEYHQGQVIPDYRSCHNCYCSSGSIICDKIKCSPALAGCQPIIPEGHCCPVSYKCGERLDEDVEEPYNSPVENFNSSGNSSENSTTPEITTDQITTHLRENDKTIDLEIAKSGAETTPIYPQTGDHLNNGTSFVTKSMFLMNQKRNNSKQPSSIIDLEHHITTHSHSYNSNETKSTVNTYAPSTTTENLYKSTTETPEEKITFQETTGSAIPVTTVTNKNLDSTLVHTTLYFAEDEDILHKTGLTPLIVTGRKENRIYTKPKVTNTPAWFVTDSATTKINDNIPPEEITLVTNTKQITKLPNRINGKLSSSYSNNETNAFSLNSSDPLIEDSLVNTFLPPEGRDIDSSDFY
ncbi:uncharacterized protein CEXT_750861 [Caerostris extrusa]|uniref:VWFC domain-containing protein n=1 Tax=Caerostris extrusa TaxID=172846 RepID=A0AAV4PQ56_CAEEX|nr:uncharacterized protein CEXT_750861 [Caerostris extrusa]